MFAAQCSAALAAAISREGFEDALESRDRIGQAKGVLMSKRKLTAAEAFEALRDMSQERNVPLTDLARHVAETGDLPD